MRAESTRAIYKLSLLFQRISTIKHGQIITAITKDTPNIRALFLDDSFGNGMDDKYSDVDFIMVAARCNRPRMARKIRNRAWEKLSEMLGVKQYYL
jgi:hypothetical protein